MSRNFFDIFRKFKFLAGNDIYFIILLSFFVALSESIGIALFIPLLDQFITDSGNKNLLEEPQTFIGELVSKIQPNDASVEILLTLIFVLFLTKSVFLFLVNNTIARSRSRFLTTLKLMVYDIYLTCNYENFQKMGTGYFINLYNEQVWKSVTAYKMFTRLCVQYILSLVYIFIAIAFNPIVGVTCITVGLLTMRSFQKINILTKSIADQSIEYSEQSADDMVQLTKSYKYLFSIDARGVREDLIRNNISKLSMIIRKHGKLYSFTQAAQEPIVIALLALSFFTYYTISTLTVSNFFVTILILYRAATALVGTQGILQGLLENMSSIDVITAKSDEMKLTMHEYTDENEIRTIEQIELCHVSHYALTNTPDKHLLHDINLTIEKNDFVILRGKSGSGKSTLLDILSALYPPERGCLKINGIPAQNSSIQTYRKNIGYVPQQNELMSGSIAEIITNKFSVHLSKIELEKVCHVLKLVSLYELFNDGPLSLTTPIRTGGHSLSGGQVQRICIARELYRNPSVLFLDEVTSALDIASEREIKATLSRLKGKLTVVMVTHSQNLLDLGDAVYEVSDNNIKCVMNGVT